MNDLTDMLERAVDDAPDKVAFDRVDERESRRLTYAELLRDSIRIAEYLSSRYVEGDRVALVFDDSMDAVGAFFGCQRAGIIAVPLAYPGKRAERADTFRRLMHASGARIALTSDSLSARHDGSIHGVPTVSIGDIERQQSISDGPGRARTKPDGDAVAYLQYTSGSVGSPKGVVVLQRNVLANIAQIAGRFRLPKAVRTVSWLPYFHDQGLVGGLLVPVFLGGSCRTMSPLSFAQEPMRWIETVAETQAQFSGGPNFAYEQCARAVERTGPRPDLDLSAWSVAFNGAEKVHAQTLGRFCDAFAPSRFRPHFLAPCYGLAEATLAVTVPHPDPARAFTADGQDVTCGAAVDGAEVAIVDPATRRRSPDGGVGEIWVRGPMVAAGYWQDSRQTEKVFRASVEGESTAVKFLRTGDLGYLREGRLCVLSRRDDVIVVRGRNVYPADVEQTVLRSSPLLGSGAAALVQAEDGDVHLVVELSRAGSRATSTSALQSTIIEACSKHHGIVPDRIWLAPKAALPKTTSGKVQRRRCKQLIGQGAFAALPAAAGVSDRAVGTSTQVESRIAAVVARCGCAWLKSGDEDALLLDSLDGLRVRHALETEFRCILPAGLLMARVGLRELCDAVQSGAGALEDDADPWQVTRLQEELWLKDKLVPHTSSSVLGFSVALPRRTDAQAVRRIVEAAIRENPTWNARLRESRDGSATFVPLADPVRIEVKRVEGDALPACEADWFDRPLDLRAGPPVRVALWSTPQADVVCFAAHHLVSDEESLRLVLTALHRDSCEEIGSTRGFQRFRRWMQDHRPEEDAAWWRSRLRGYRDFDAFDRQAKTDLSTYATATGRFDLSPEAGAEIDRLATASGRTRASLFLAALAAAIAGYSGRTDIVVACPVSLRMHAAFRQALGALINTIPIRVEVRGESRVDAILDDADAALRAARTHGRFASQDILRQSAQERTDSISPLARAVLNFIDTSGEPPDITAALRQVRRPHPHTDLYVCVDWRREGVRVESSTYANRYGAEFVAGFMAHLQHLLSNMARCRQLTVDAWIRQSPAIPRARVMPAPAEWPCGRLDDAVLRAARRVPERQALRWRGVDGRWQGLGYEALLAHAAALARRLRRSDAGVVGVLLRRSAEQIVAILGVLRAGHAWLPLDPSLPAARLKVMMDDSRCSTVVTTRQFEPLLPASATAVHVDDIGTSHPPADSQGVLAAEPVSYSTVIFTSGSSGRPKGVALSHAAYLNRLSAMTAELDVKATDVFLQKTTFAFDVSVWEMFLPLINGATLVLAGEQEVRDPERLDALMREAGVNIVHFVPTQLQLWLDRRDKARDLPALKACLCSGEVLQAASRDEFRRQLPRSRLINLYGPTECAIDVTRMDVTDAVGAVPIGSPTAGVGAFVLDSATNAVPHGVAGELHLAGVQLAAGYIGRPGLTAERFIPCPFLPGERMYRTGDQVWRGADGTLHYLGRIDEQVKLHGQRIELAEIRAAARRHPGVLDAAVSLLQRSDGPALALAVAAGEDVRGGGTEVDDLREHLAAQLPSYMVPRFIRVLAALPVTSNGKCDFASLQAQFESCDDPARGTGDDSAIAGIRAAWQRCLGIPVPSPDTDFFRMGGDSILAIRLIAELEALGYASSISDVYAHRTVRTQAFGLRRIGTPSPARAIAPFELIEAQDKAVLPAGLEDAYPLSMLQRSIVFQSGTSAYETYVSYVRVRGELRMSAMQSAVNAVVAGHPFLRSAFDLANASEPLQIVHAHVRATLRLYDLRSLPGKEAEDALASWRRDELARGFAWERAPLLRFAVHAISPAEFVLHMTDVSLDGWCVASVMTQVLEGYDAELAGAHSRKPEAGPSYAVFVALERAAIDSMEIRQFWQQTVADRRPSLMASRHDRIPRGGPGTRERITLPIAARTAKAVERLAGIAETPLKSVYLAAFSKCVSVMSGAGDWILAGLEVNGRPEIRGGDQTIGAFNNIVPWAVPVSTRDPAAFVREVFEAERRLLPHRRYPYAKLKAAHGEQVMFDALFVFTDFHVLDRLAALEHCRVVDLSSSDQTYIPVTFHLNRSGFHAGYRLLLDVDTAVVDGDRALRIANAYLAALQGLTERWDRHPDGDPDAGERGSPAARGPAMTDGLERIRGSLPQ